MAIILGTTEDDVLTGTDGADNIRGLEGDDVLSGGGGYDVISDGPGNDTIYVGTDGGVVTANTGDSISRDVFLGSGTAGDSFLSYWSSESIVADFRRGIVYGENIGRDDVFLFDNITLPNDGEGGDIFHGNDNANIVRDNGGQDVIYTYGGNDDITDTAGGCRIVSGDGDDVIRASTFDGRIFVHAGSGNDDVTIGRSENAVVHCGDGDDNAIIVDSQFARFFGGAGNDHIYATGGDASFVSGGAGDDVLIADSCRIAGGAGADVFTTYPSAERTNILDFEDGIDKLDLQELDWEVLIANARDTVHGVLAEFGQDEFFLRGMTVAQLDAGDFL